VYFVSKKINNTQKLFKYYYTHSPKNIHTLQVFGAVMTILADGLYFMIK